MGIGLAALWSLGRLGWREALRAGRRAGRKAGGRVRRSRAATVIAASQN